MYKMSEKFKNAALTIYTRKIQEKIIKYEDSEKERSKYSVLIFCHFNFQRTIYTIHMLRKRKILYIKSSRNVLFKCEQKLYLN